MPQSSVFLYFFASRPYNNVIAFIHCCAHCCGLRVSQASLSFEPLPLSGRSIRYRQVQSLRQEQLHFCDFCLCLDAVTIYVFICFWGNKTIIEHRCVIYCCWFCYNNMCMYVCACMHLRDHRCRLLYKCFNPSKTGISSNYFMSPKLAPGAFEGQHRRLTYLHPCLDDI